VPNPAQVECGRDRSRHRIKVHPRGWKSDNRAEKRGPAEKRGQATKFREMMILFYEVGLAEFWRVKRGAEKRGQATKFRDVIVLFYEVGVAEFRSLSPLFRGLLALGEGYFCRDGLVAPQNFYVHFIARFVGAQGIGEIVQVPDVFGAKFHQNVTGLQPGFAGG